MSDLLEDIDSLKADIHAANELLEQANSSLKTKDEALSARDSEIASLKEALKGKEAEAAKLLQDFTALQAKEASASAKAVEIVASQGIAPLPVKVEANATQSREDLLKQYAGITNSKDKGTFWAKHRKELFPSFDKKGAE